MKHSFLIIWGVLAIAILHGQYTEAHHHHRHNEEDPSGRSGVDTLLKNIDRNVNRVMLMVTEGFKKMENKLDQVLKLVSSRNSTSGMDFEKIDSDLTEFGNYTDLIEDEDDTGIEYNACRNESSRNYGESSDEVYEQVGLDGNTLQRMKLIPPSAQSNLTTINLKNLEIDNHILLKSLQYACNLENLTLINVNLLNSSNLGSGEIYLPNLQNYILNSKSESRHLDLSQLFPFTRNGSKWNTDIAYYNRPSSSCIGLRILPEKGRIELDYIPFSDNILSNLAPDFDLKELVVTMGSPLRLDLIPSTLKLLSLSHVYYDGTTINKIIQKSSDLQHFHYTDSSPGISIALSDLPATLETLTISDTRIRYSPNVRLPKLEKLDLNDDRDLLDSEIVNNVANIFPNLQKVVLYIGGPIVEKFLNMSSVKQFVTFRNNYYYAPAYDEQLKGCRSVWCNAERNSAGTWTVTDVKDVQNLIDEIFPEYIKSIL